MTETPPAEPGVLPTGRPSKLTPELRDRIVRVIRAGNYLKVAAQFNGVGESTLRLWLQRGRKAAAARDAHPEGRSYCPSCDADRTVEVEAVAQHNARQEEQEEDQPRAYAVLNRCPSCGSQRDPQPWEVPEREAPFLDFLEVVTQAETAAEVAAVTHWRAAFPTDWRAARDYLRYTQPDRWSPVTRVSVTPEEADKRIEEATMQVLTSLGVDTDAYGGDLLLPGDLDPETAALDGGQGAEEDDGWGDDDA